MVTGGQGFPSGAHRPRLRHGKGRREKQIYRPQLLQRPNVSLGKTRQRLTELCGVSWGQKLMVPVIPHIAQMECCAASLLLGTAVRIIQVLI